MHRYGDDFRLLLDEPLGPGGGRVRLMLADASTLFLQASPADGFEPLLSYAVAPPATPSAPVPSPEVERPEDGQRRWIFRTEALTVDVRFDPFRLRVEDAHGVVRFEGTDLRVEGREVVLARELQPGEGVYGLGEQGETFNRNPGVYRIWNKDEPVHHAFRQYYCTIPAGISVPGGARGPHAFLVDNPGEVFFDVGRTAADRLTVRTRTGDLRLFLFVEETPAELLERSTALTGRIWRPPLWALGYQQCRWSYPTEARIREVTSTFRAKRIPCDVIYFDIDYMEDYKVFTWGTKAFPDPAGLLRDLAGQGFSAVTIVDPGVAKKAGYHAFEVGLRTPGFFLRRLNGDLITERVWPGDVHMPDFTHSETRRLWGEWQHEHLLQLGIAGIWNDMNEPAVFAQDAPTREFPADAQHHDGGLGRPHVAIHNVYGLTMAQASTEGQFRHRPDRRPFTLTRSGWAGIQRYSAVWTGDNASSWSAMPMDLALNLNMGLSGVPFVGCDIGGFSFHATPELFVRWFEWGIFQPFCRGHAACWSIDQEPWAFGAATEHVVRRMIELRYQLLPYLYTAFVEASETGMPINRPLVLEYPSDATVLSIGDEFLVGSDLLVAPLLQPGVMRRAVYLPPGDWVHTWTGARHGGGGWILAEAPFGQPPLYARAGAVIPMHPIRQHTKEAEPETTFLDVYPGPRLSGRLVEDDGASMEYLQGRECRTLFSGEETDAGLHLVIGLAQGPWRPARKAWTVRLHRPDRAVVAVTVQGAPVPFERLGGVTTFTLPAERKVIDCRVVYAS